MLWEDNCLAHYGIKGQRWGLRRFQNEDGSLTEAGKKRYGKDYEEVNSNLYKAQKSLNDAIYNGGKQPKSFSARMSNRYRIKRAKKEVSKLQEVKTQMPEYKNDVSKKYNQATTEVQKVIDSLSKLPNGSQKTQLATKMLDEYKKLDNQIHEDLYSVGSIHGLEKYEESHPYEYTKWSKYGAYIAGEVLNKSMNGYSGIPKSARNKALYDYDPDGYDSEGAYSFSLYIPKYVKSKEYQDLEKKILQARSESGLDKAEHELRDSDLNRLSMREFERRHKVLEDARKKFERISKPYKDSEEKMWESHKKQIIKNALRDMGWPVNEKYFDLIEAEIWYD